MFEHVENDWLTWQRASSGTNPQFQLSGHTDPPKRLGNYYPTWFKELKADLRQYLPDGYDQNHTARVCVGLRGINTVGWTLTNDHDLNKGQLEFHPEQMHGTPWAEKNAHGEYVWRIFLKTYPWRAKMRKGFRLIIVPYALEFSQEWHTFSGSVDANYKVDDQQQMGGIYWYDEPIDANFNYFNVETVVAVRQGSHIPRDVVYFVMLPVWDPEYQGINTNIPSFS